MLAACAHVLGRCCTLLHAALSASQIRLQGAGRSSCDAMLCARRLLLHHTKGVRVAILCALDCTQTTNYTFFFFFFVLFHLSGRAWFVKSIRATIAGLPAIKATPNGPNVARTTVQVSASQPNRLIGVQTATTANKTAVWTGVSIRPTPTLLCTVRRSLALRCYCLA